MTVREEGIFTLTDSWQQEAQRTCPSQLGGKEEAGDCGQEPSCGLHDEECSGRAEQVGLPSLNGIDEPKNSPESSDAWPWCVRGDLWAPRKGVPCPWPHSKFTRRSAGCKSDFPRPLTNINLGPSSLVTSHFKKKHNSSLLGLMNRTGLNKLVRCAYFSFHWQ